MWLRALRLWWIFKWSVKWLFFRRNCHHHCSAKLWVPLHGRRLLWRRVPWLLVFLRLLMLSVWLITSQ